MRATWAVLLVAGVALAQPAIVEPLVSDFPGGTHVPDSYVFSPGDKVYIHFRLEGTADVRIEAFDSRGKLLEPAIGIPGASGIVERFIVLPGGLWPGDGKFRITAGSVNAEVPFRVASELAEPPQRLAVERFRLYRDDVDTAPADPPVFGIGALVWARFLLAGFGVGASGETDVQYGVSLQNKAGRVVVSEPRAVVERARSFYPRAYVQAVVSLRLEYRIPKGEYSLVITAVDAMSKQKVRAEHPFRIE